MIQNYKVLIKIINKKKNLKIKWYIIGGGRRFNELIKIKSSYDLFNLELIDHIPLSEIYNYRKKADILFISQKGGRYFLNNGKFSTYLNLKNLF